MDNLVRVIGKAPSEMPYDLLLERLREERERVRRNLIFLKNNPSGKVKKAKGRTKKDITAALEAAGLTEEEFMKGLALLKGETE